MEQDSFQYKTLSSVVFIYLFCQKAKQRIVDLYPFLFYQVEMQMFWNHTNHISSFNYFASDDINLKWGLQVSKIGCWAALADHTDVNNLDTEISLSATSMKDTWVFDDYQLIFISEGKGILLEGESKSKMLRAGDAVLLWPNTSYQLIPDSDAHWTTHWVGFGGTMIEQWTINGFLTSEKSIFQVGHRSDFTELFARASEIGAAQKPSYAQHLSGIVVNMLGLALYLDDINRSKSREEQAVAEAKRLIKSHICENISPIQIADRLNVSYSWFRKTFKESTGKSPKQYIQSKKIQLSKHLLQHTEEPVHLISHKLNFHDMSHFSNIFKATIGFTPKEYRAMAKGA